MTTTTYDLENTATVADAPSTANTFATRLSSIGDHAVRHSVALVLAWIGAMKFTAYEAGAIEGLVASSPLVGWLYGFLDLQGVSNLIGSIEIATAVALVAGTVYRPAAIAGALGAIAIFATTLTFLFTAPGWEESLGGFPALSVVPGQFLLKDIVLLAASVSLLAKATSSNPAN